MALEPANNQSSFLKLFDYKNKQVRSIVDKLNNIWFSGKDVATILEYSNTRQAIRKNVDNKDKILFSTLLRLNGEEATNSPLQNFDEQTLLVNESGLYDLIYSSKKPEARAFRRWITSEVIPTIRKTGSYSVKQDNSAKMLELKNESTRLQLAKIKLFQDVKNNTSLPQCKHLLEQHITNSVLHFDDTNTGLKAITYENPESYMLEGITQLAVDNDIVTASNAQKHGSQCGRYISKKFRATYPNEPIGKGKRIFAQNGSYITPNTYKLKYKAEIISWIKEFFVKMKEKTNKTKRTSTRKP